MIIAPCGCVAKRWPDLRHIHGKRIEKTWRSPLQKANDAPEAEYKWLHEIADGLLPEVRKAFLEAVERLRGTLAEADLQAALESGNVDTVMRALNIDQTFGADLNATMTKPLEDAFIEAGRAAPERTIPTQLRAGQASMRFDLTNPNAVRFLQQYDFGMIKEVSQGTRDAVRRVVLDAFQNGGSPKVQAKSIRQFIGLTDRQAQAALNYRNALIEEQRPADQVERMAEKYNQKLLRLRAETIARTETIRASTAGQDASWSQAADKGLINRATARQGWMVTPDDRLCIYCAAIPALNPNGVPLGGLFQTPLGPVSGSPLHPLCRCIKFLMNY